MFKTNLSNAERKELLHELARSGSPVDLSVAVTEVKNAEMEILQVSPIHDSRIFELENGRVGYMFGLAVTNRTSRTIDVVDVELGTSWEEGLFEWLTPRSIKSQGRGKRESSYLAYQFPGKNGWRLEYGDVINHHLRERCRLPGKQRLEGWLLGIGGLMPAELRHGQPLDLPLTILGSGDAEGATTLHLCTERLESRANITKQRRSGLYANPGEGNMRPRDTVDHPISWFPPEERSGHERRS